MGWRCSLAVHLQVPCRRHLETPHKLWLRITCRFFWISSRVGFNLRDSRASPVHIPCSSRDEQGFCFMGTQRMHCHFNPLKNQIPAALRSKAKVLSSSITPGTLIVSNTSGIGEGEGGYAAPPSTVSRPEMGNTVPISSTRKRTPTRNGTSLPHLSGVFSPIWCG